MTEIRSYNQLVYLWLSWVGNSGIFSQPNYLGDYGWIICYLFFKAFHIKYKNTMNSSAMQCKTVSRLQAYYLGQTNQMFPNNLLHSTKIMKHLEIWADKWIQNYSNPSGLIHLPNKTGPSIDGAGLGWSPDVAPGGPSTTSLAWCDLWCV